MAALRLGAHFLSKDVLHLINETETLDACIEFHVATIATSLLL